MGLLKKKGVRPKEPVVDKAEAKELEEAGLTIEKGNFIFGHCEACDWVGKARRSRASAHDDAKAHAKVCEGKKAVHVDETHRRVAPHQ